MGQMQQVALIATCLPMSAIAGEPSGMMYELRAGRLACVAQVQQSSWPSMSPYRAGAFLALEVKFDAPREAILGLYGSDRSG